MGDNATGQCLRGLQSHTGPVNALALAPDGRWAISGGGSEPPFGIEDYQLRVWWLGGTPACNEVWLPARDSFPFKLEEETSCFSLIQSLQRRVSLYDRSSAGLFEVHAMRYKSPYLRNLTSVHPLPMRKLFPDLTLSEFPPGSYVAKHSQQRRRHTDDTPKSCCHP